MDYIYEDEIIDVIDIDDDDDDDADDYRNASRVYHRRPSGSKPPGRRTAPPSRTNPRRTSPVRVQRRRAPVVVRRPVPQRPPVVAESPDRLSVRKDALIGLIPIAGQMWAAFLGIPGAPEATGNDVVDRDNATAHREALARHNQNRDRILALTNAATRAATLLLD